MLVMALDGNSLAYRAFHALPDDLANSAGQTTNAVHGFATMFATLVREHRPDGVVVVFDRPEPTFRHEAVPEYKAQRERAPETLVSQLAIIRDLLGALGVRWVEAPGFEGDDLIATMADRASREGIDFLAVSGDRDCFQIVRDPHVRVLYNLRGVSEYAIYDESGILGRTGVTPEQYPDYAALRGDPSDNLEGVPGVGEKTAARLLGTYGDLAGVLAHAVDQTPKLAANLAEHGARVARNARVMVLRRDAPADVDLAALAPRPDLGALRSLLDMLEMRTVVGRFEALAESQGWEVRGTGTERPAPAEVPGAPASVRVLDARGAVEFLGRPGEAVMAARWEGEPGRSSLIGLAAVEDAPGSATVWIGAGLLDEVSVRAALAAHPAVVIHDAKPLMRALLGRGIDIQGLVLDTKIAAYLVDPLRSGYTLASCALDHLGAEPSSPAEPSALLDFASPGGDPAAAAGEEALFTAALARVLVDRLEGAGASALYTTVENPLVRVLARMEEVGVAVDASALVSIRDRLADESAGLVATIHSAAGHEFNVNSTAQLRTVLYEERGLAPRKKTKTGFSTDATTLETLEPEWPEFIGPLLRYREVEKLRSTYGEGLIAEIDARDSRIHATFNQTVARTGRLSSDRPNLHNIPVRTDEGRVFRTAFVAGPGNDLLVADYDQIELRCIAHLSGDPGLVAAFAAGVDIHRAVASSVFGVAPADVSHEQRSRAKMVSYGLAYGMEAYGLGQRLGIGVSEAAAILDSYFMAYPGVRTYMESSVREARQKGYTETLFGRRRPVPELTSDNFRVRQAGERQAMNAAIQGLAADIFKIALVATDGRLQSAGLAGRIVLQVHDEVIVEAPSAEMDAVAGIVVSAMTSAADLSVPLAVNTSRGGTWADAKP